MKTNEMRTHTITALIAGALLLLSASKAQCSEGATLPTNSPVPLTSTGSPNSLDRSLASSPGFRNSPTQASSFSTEPGTFRSWFVDGTAAIFGVLAVFFAILTVLITILGVIFSVLKFRDLMRRLESDLREKVDESFGRRLDDVVKNEITPKVNDIIKTELGATLETATETIKAEIAKTIERSDLKEELIKAVAAEIQARLNGPGHRGLQVEPKEFER